MRINLAENHYVQYMKILSNKEFERLTAQAKGYYGGDNAENLYFKAIDKEMQGLRLPDPTRMNRQQIKDAYETIAPVNGLVDYIADNVAEVAQYLELYDVRKEDYVEKHPLLTLIHHPNDRQNLRKFVHSWAVNRLLYGDAWVYAPQGIGKNRDVTEMYVIPSHRIITDSKGLQEMLKGVVINGTAKDIPFADIFESFTTNLDDTSFYGTSKIVAAAQYLAVIEKGMQRETTALNNGGAANIVTPKADANGMSVLPTDADNIEQKFNSGRNINKTLALRIPIEVHSLGNNPVDLNILGSHDKAMEVLCFLYKVPYDIYKGQAKYENAKESKKSIYELNAIPLVNEFAEDLLYYLRRRNPQDKELENLRLIVNTDRIEALKDKASDVLDNLEKMNASINEKRMANGYKPIDEDYCNQPMVQIGTQFGEGLSYDIDEPL